MLSSSQWQPLAILRMLVLSGAARQPGCRKSTVVGSTAHTDFLSSLAAMCSIAATSFIVVEALIALRSLPPAAYETPTWT